MNRRTENSHPDTDSSAHAFGEFIQQADHREQFVREIQPLLERDPRIAVDTEFIRERTYAPVLEIVQIAVVGESGVRVALLDIPALNGDFGSLGELLRNPAYLKIVHAGSQDVELLTTYLGGFPENLFDTQVAAAFIGQSLQTGYGALVQAMLGVTLSKDEGFADWSRRPLTAAMREYAENDVRYLHALHDRLRHLLEKRGRLDWAQEQTDQSLRQAAENVPQEELWRQVRGRHVLTGRGLAILRELAIWRDEEAKRRDKPRRSVLKDDILVEIARRRTDTASKVLGLRGAPPNLGERAAEALAAQVRRGMEADKNHLPEPEMTISLTEQESALVELLSAVVRARAAQEYLPPSLLAGSDELRMLAASVSGKCNQPASLFTGWRGTLIGEDLHAVLNGEYAARWDPKKRTLVVTAVPPA
ncbi:MAG: ribonuclease D [Armatimonadaceae bacterium]